MIFALLAPLGLTGCGGETPEADPLEASAAGEADSASGAELGVEELVEELFVDRAEAAGLDFVHRNGMSGELYFVEMLGSGVALVDYDRDGDLDVFFPQGNPLGPEETATPHRDRLYRNELVSQASAGGSAVAEGGALRFTDVTEESGIDGRGYALGVAAGDYDNDGWTDLYVVLWGRNQLWRNRGDGTFEDVTDAAGAGDPGWSSSAAFVDLDGDGWLDLYVVNYVRFTFDNHKPCFAPSSAVDYCGPLAFEPQADVVLRNRRDGTFESLTLAPPAAGLGVATADFDGDGALDVYVANDQYENQLWRSRSDGSLEDSALLSGAAVNLVGDMEASMGVDAADFDGDGDEDIFLTHLSNETNTLYRNDGHGGFTDATAAISLGAPSWPYTSFGTAWLDYDGDGWLDLFVANGEVRRIREQVEAGDPHPMRQPNQLFRNLQGRGFEEVTARAGKVFELSEVSRGAAVGDVDNDGDPDIVVTNNNGPVRLMINQSPPRSWLGVRVLVGDPGRDALGARLALELSDGRTLWRRVRSDASFASANDPRVLFALPGASADALTVHWPDGAVERWDSPAPGRYHTLRQGEGSLVGTP
ncbi:MAG: CRTAC1 family protein [Acidobacteriota bacterium]|nr:CRTAC1 family protein [Acidobacteriota bacterium]